MIVSSPFINRVLEELLSFGEISLDTVEPLADRFLITYQRWAQMMMSDKEIRRKWGFLHLHKEIHQRDGDETSLLPRYRKKNYRGRILPADEASRRLLAVS